MRKYLIIMMLLSCLHNATRGQTIPEVDLSWIPQSTKAKALRCWFDDDASSVMTASVDNNFSTIDASSLIEGVHTLHYQVIGEDGKLGAIASSVFIKTGVRNANPTAKSLRYWIDEDVTSAKIIDVTNGTQTIDVADLQTGIHTLYYQLIDSEGRSGVPVARLFMKGFDNPVAIGENRVVKYQYWQNQNSREMVTVDLTNADNPFKLISLLPMRSDPISSQQFQFEVTDGQPTIYAKNTFHVRFHDARGYFTDNDATFVDYSVKQTVTDIEPLESGVSAMIVKPAENAIKWYKVLAQKGDSLTFRTHQACTLQLFSPSGKELYSASSPEVLKFDGSYAPEDGTYYIAIHDAKSQYDNNLKVEYQHIDKYAVLNYTPKETGVATSFLYMKIDGNGYDKLQNASLINGETEIIASDITISSKSSIILQYTLNGNEATGMYDLVLLFKDEEETETLTVSEAIRFSDASFGDITIKVEPTRRAGFPYPVIVRVKNTGNVTKLYVPFNLAASFNLTGQKPSEDLNGCSWTSMYTMNFDVLSVPDDEYADYSPYTLTDNLIGTGLPGVVLHGFIPELGPYETKEYILGFVGGAHQMFNLYAWTGKPLNENSELDTSETNIYSVWDYLAEYNRIRNNLDSRKGATRAPDFDGNGVNTVLNVADQINGNAGRAARNSVGIGLEIGGIINSLRLNNIHAYTDGDDFAASVLEDYEASVRSNMPTPRQIGDVGGIPRWIQYLLGLQDGQSQCGTPIGEATLINIYAPDDPNDILGYTSESGSKYVREGVTDVYYTIEFENDPEIANAAAHTIVVRDELDKKCFDLSSFAAKSVKLGKKVMELDGEKNFSKRTMDLRPEINVIAQVSLSLDENNGIAQWTIESFDPMTMDPTDDVMQGILPVNVNGNGLGEVIFDIKLKSGLSHGTKIKNRAGIVFDTNDVIMTPYWTNVIDRVAPESHVTNVKKLDDETAELSISATDELSGLWRYDVYVQYGIGSAWFKAAENVPIDKTANVKVYEGMENNFYVIATDSAGNVENKIPVIEYTLSDVGIQHHAYDFNGDGKVNDTDVAIVADCIMKGGKNLKFDINTDGKVNSADIVTLVNLILDDKIKPYGARNVGAD